MTEHVNSDLNHRRDMMIIAAIVFVALIPFVNKAYHLDDPFYLWTGQHILEHPFDFYGYDLNWTGFESSAAAENKNPPLVSYYMALVGLLVGWQEWTMHLAFILPAIGVGLGGYRVATRFTQRPLLAMTAGLMTPAFVVSSTNVMAEIMMLCFYVWAIHFWMLGIERKSNRYLFVAALCIAGSTLAKYFGFSLLPLLFVYSLIEVRRPGHWITFLALALGIVLLYEAWTLYLYDIGLLGEAANFATSYRDENEVSRNTKAFVGLAFTGGCVVIVALLSPVLFSWKWHVPICASAAYFFFIAYSYPHIFQEQHILKREYTDWNFIVHFTAFSIAGIYVLLLPLLDLFHHRNRQSLFLILWVGGTFLFATQVNWTANARSIVPMVPAIGILIGRRLALLYPEGNLPFRRIGAGLTLCTAISLTLTYADYTLARTGKEAAQFFGERYTTEDPKVRFTGHWGYQYYMMENEYFEPLVYVPTDFQAGEVIVICENNTGLFLEAPQREFAETTEFEIFNYATVWSKSHRAGFYADVWGGIPYAFGHIPDEAYHTMTFAVDFHVSLDTYKPGSEPVEALPLP